MGKEEKTDKTLSNNNGTQQNKEAVRIAKLELKNELYKEVIHNYEITISRFNVCLRIVVSLFAIVVGVIFSTTAYIVYVKTTEFNKILKEARDTVSNIEKIDKEAKDHFIRAYYWYMAAKAIQENDRENADKYYEAINKLSEKDKDDEASYEIGELGLVSVDPFKVTTGSLTSHIPRGINLLEMSKTEQDEHKKKQLIESAKKYLKIGRTKGEGSAIYELACIAAYENNEEECRKWLELGKLNGTLPSRKIVEQEIAFKDMCNKGWFKGIWADNSVK